MKVYEIKCIYCGSENVARERRPNGDDCCKDCDKVYPSRFNGTKSEKEANESFHGGYPNAYPVTKNCMCMVNDEKARESNIRADERNKTINEVFRKVADYETGVVIGKANMVKGDIMHLIMALREGKG